MPISSNIRKAGPYTGTGLVTTYPFYFKVFQVADLYVVQADTAGVETVLALDTDYTVSLNADKDVSPGGNVVLTTALASGYALVITSSIENLQPTDLTNMGGFYPSVITDALDRACIQIQQISESTDRAIKAPLTTPTGVDMQLPVPSADKVLGWDNTGTAMRNYSLKELATSVAYGKTAIDKFTGNGSQTVFTLSSNPASQNNLYISVGGVVQNPDVDYVWTSGTTLTFTTAPPNGTVVLVRYMLALAQGDAESVSGNLNFSGIGARITGDFSNATIANRTMLQTSTVDGNTNVIAIPNGTGSTSSFIAFGSSDTVNASLVYIRADTSSNQTVISSTKVGTGAYLPISFQTGGSKRLYLATDGTFTSVSGAIGYGTGAGGTVTQSTSKSTPVTLNKPCGQITMHNAALAAKDSVNFQFNNNLITATDGLLVSTSNNYNYEVRTLYTAGGFSGIRVTSLSGDSLSEALVINFQVIKGATS